MALSGTDYAGDVNCHEAYRRLRDDRGAQLIDVRTTAEWTFVGVPDLTGAAKRPLFVEWQQAGGVANPHFLGEVEDALARSGAPAGATLYLLCRTGGRSAAAAKALTSAGYGPAYNIVHGFEGDLDGDHHRGRTNGWKADNLPWHQN